MPSSMRRLLVSAFVIAIAFSLGCGSNSLSPAAPSAVSGATSAAGTPEAVSPPSAPAATGASITGSVSANLTSPNSFRALSIGLIVSVVGTSIEAVVETSGHFELNDVPEGDVELHFSGPGVDAKVSVTEVKAHEHIDLNITVTGSTATVETGQRTTTDLRVELDGKITSLDSSGSGFRVGDTPVVVSSATQIRRGSQPVGPSDLHVGDNAHVKGIRDGSIVRADQIDLQAETTLTGIVANVAGTCPSLTFTLDGNAVLTAATTTYGGGSACTTVKNGDKRSAVGTKQNDGRVLARYVTAAEASPAPAPQPPPSTTEVTISGIVAALAGSCPTVAFTLDGVPVTTSASTTYGGSSSCAALKNGETRYVAGTKSDGRVLARYISGPVTPTPAPTPPPSTTVTISGVVAALAGSCPALTFTLDGTPVTANASTTYGGSSSCAAVKNGETRYVSGVKQSDGQVVAQYISGPATPAPTPTPPPSTEITVSGTVASLAGACPNLTFSLDGVAISTNSSTTYGGGSSCASVKNGERRYAVGTKQSDGRLLVRYVTAPVTTLSN